MSHNIMLGISQCRALYVAIVMHPMSQNVLHMSHGVMLHMSHSVMLCMSHILPFTIGSVLFCFVLTVTEADCSSFTEREVTKEKNSYWNSPGSA